MKLLQNKNYQIRYFLDFQEYVRKFVFTWTFLSHLQMYWKSLLEKLTPASTIEETLIQIFSFELKINKKIWSNKWLTQTIWISS